jgi:transcriptional regulator with XRE-family HTH domain
MSDPTAADFFKAALGERVFLWRVAIGMSRAALAEKAGVSADYVYRVEQGWANPRMTTVQAIAVALETTAAELLDLDGEEMGVVADQLANKIR